MYSVNKPKTFSLYTQAFQETMYMLKRGNSKERTNKLIGAILKNSNKPELPMVSVNTALNIGRFIESIQITESAYAFNYIQFIKTEVHY